MELFPAVDQQQLEFIKRVIDRCDYYVVIVGGRYGSIADDNVSFTEREYECALERGIPVLAFLHKVPDSIEVGKTDKDDAKARKLQAFRIAFRKEEWLITGVMRTSYAQTLSFRWGKQRPCFQG